MDAATARAAAAIRPGRPDTSRSDLAAQLLGGVVPARRRAAAGDLLCYHWAASESSPQHSLKARVLGVWPARRRPAGGSGDSDISIVTRPMQPAFSGRFGRPAALQEH